MISRKSFQDFLDFLNSKQFVSFSQGANHILIAVASCIITFLALINIIFFLQENQIYKEFVLPWIYVLDGLSVLAFMTVFVGYFQLGTMLDISKY